jgi:hypothetical protein
MLIAPSPRLTKMDIMGLSNLPPTLSASEKFIAYVSLGVANCIPAITNKTIINFTHTFLQLKILFIEH